jgi:hypothetical protein
MELRNRKDASSMDDFNYSENRFYSQCLNANVLFYEWMYDVITIVIIVDVLL